MGAVIGALLLFSCFDRPSTGHSATVDTRTASIDRNPLHSMRVSQSSHNSGSWRRATHGSPRVWRSMTMSCRAAHYSRALIHRDEWIIIY